MEQLGAGGGTEGVEALPEPPSSSSGLTGRRRPPSDCRGACHAYCGEGGGGGGGKEPGGAGEPLGHQEPARIDWTLCPPRLPRTQSG